MAEEEAKVGTGLFTCEMTNNSGTRVIDITDVINVIEYYEDILSPSISVRLLIQDAANLKTFLPIVGGEKVVLKFSDSFADTIKIRLDDELNPLRVYKISSRERLRDKLEGYSILCTTDHMLKQQYMTVDRTYTNQLSSAIASNVMGSYFNYEITELEETVGRHTFTFARVTPFQAINQLMTETESNLSGSSCYFFFQNNDGYNLRNLDTMLSQPVRQVEEKDVQYQYITGETGGDDQFQGTRILEYSETVSFDLLDGILGGQYGSRTQYFDPIRKRIDETDYIHETDHIETDHSNRNPLISANTVSDFGTSASIEKYMVSNYSSIFSDYITSRDETIRNSFRRKQNIAGKRQAVLARIKNSKINIVVHGDSRIMVGQTILLQFPTGGDIKESDEQVDKFVSGKYLITAVHHNISDTDYKTVLTCVKDTYIKSPNDGGEL